MTTTPAIPEDLWEKVHSLLTENRRQRMSRVVSQRTEQVRLVLQDVHQPHNISACLRSAEAFGIQHCHVVTHHQKFRASTCAKGVSGWLTIHQHNSVAEVADTLHELGYGIIAGCPEAPQELGQIDAVKKPLAVVFGNEHAGISDDWKPYLDGTFVIPMTGFVESLNISVSAAITMQHLRSTLDQSKENFLLTPKKQNSLLNLWTSEQLRNWPEAYRRMS